MHKFRKCILPAVLIVFLSANALLSHILYPYTYTRAMFHEMQTADYDTRGVGLAHCHGGECHTSFFVDGIDGVSPGIIIGGAEVDHQ